MKRTIRLLALPAAVALVVAATLAALLPGSATSDPSRPGNPVLARALAIELGQAKPKKYEMVLSSGVMYAMLQQTGVLEQRAAKAAKRYKALRARGARAAKRAPVGLFGHDVTKANAQGCPNVFSGRGMKNIRVNQDCSLRRQAEEVVVVNPRNSRNLVAGQNDSRIGFNHCGYDWSFDGGQTWGDQVPPFWQHLLVDVHTADACSDPTAGFDTQGNVYVGGILFNVASDANSLVVAKSNHPHGGTFYHSPAPLPFQEYRTAPLGVVSNVTDPFFDDKELLVADDQSGSPKADNVYMTWTRFQFGVGPVGQESPIFFSQSTNGGATWSPGVEISGSGAFCTDFSNDPGNANRCDQDQGSHPIVGPDGTVYVVFGNGNTPNPGENQVLFVKCDAGGDCSDQASWTPPTRIDGLIGTHPIGNPGNPAGCPVGRQCLPPNGYRVPEFTSMSISVDRDHNLYAVWSDFRNGDDPGSTCGPLIAWTAATPPCDNDVFYATSTNGGATWSATRNITPAAKLGPSAQWQPWSEVTFDGDTLVAAYYDRQYGSCEFSGCNDITAAMIHNPLSASPTVKYKRITTGSMPNLVVANNPIQAGFLGDYMWVETEESGRNPRAHIVWADTRPIFGGFPEEDVYYASIRAKTGAPGDD